MNLSDLLAGTERVRNHRLTGPASIVLIVAIFVVAYSNAPDDTFSDVNWPLAILVGLLAPVELFSSALEFRSQALLHRRKLPMVDCLEIAVSGRIANLLPIPGGVVVKAAVLDGLGVPKKAIGLSSLTVGLTWIGAATFVAGLTLVALQSWFAALFFAAGMPPCVIAWMTARKVGRDGFGTLAMVEVGGSVFTACRFGLLIAALTPFGFLEGAPMGAAAALSASASFLPSGLGLQEFVTGVIARSVGVPFLTGVVAAGVIRLMGLGASLLGAGWLAYRGSLRRLQERSTLTADANRQPTSNGDLG